MKSKFLRFFVVFLAAIVLITGATPITDAYSSHMIIINSNKNTLNYYVNGTLKREFRCATGKSSTQTPQGKTTIVKKIKNRPFYQTGIPGGDPRNPLGKRWMGLGIRYTYGNVYGIHGTNDESSIGKHVSHGCVRMHNKDVEWLYDQVPIYTTVLIKNTSYSDNYIANYYGYKIKSSTNTGSTHNGWFKSNGYTYYRKSNGYLAKGWTTINGSTYYFGRVTAKMYRGWTTIGGNKYYLGRVTGKLYRGLTTIGGNKYYLEESTGKMHKSWATINGNTYYFGRVTGKMYRGWTTIGGHKYYFGRVTGKMYKGWTTIRGHRYHLGETTGRLY